MNRYIAVLAALLTAFSLSGCGYLVAGGAGAAAGYKAKEKGYQVQSPVVKENQKQPAQ